MSYYIVLFFIYSLIGWFYEVFYYLMAEKILKNPGFLSGPVLPIYGVGALTVTFLIKYVSIFDINNPYFPINIFIFSFFGSAILEFFTHYFLEKHFHAVWWDYSNFPFNIQGRISLFTSIGFGIAGIVVPKTVIPFIINFLSQFPDIFFEITALICVSLFSADLAITVYVLTDFIQNVHTINKSVNDYLNNSIHNVLETANDKKDKILSIKNTFIDKTIKNTFKNHSFKYRLIINNVKSFKIKETPGVIADKIKSFLRFK